MRIPPTARALLREYHRRQTRFTKQATNLSALQAEQIRGELIGLRGAVGIALGEKVRGGGADQAAAELHARWRLTKSAATAACSCDPCTAGGPA
jgi:hypothetical protein